MPESALVAEPKVEASAERGRSNEMAFEPDAQAGTDCPRPAHSGRAPCCALGAIGVVVSDCRAAMTAVCVDCRWQRAARAVRRGGVVAASARRRFHTRSTDRCAPVRRRTPSRTACGSRPTSARSAVPSEARRQSGPRWLSSRRARPAGRRGPRPPSSVPAAHRLGRRARLTMPAPTTTATTIRSRFPAASALHDCRFG